MTYTAEMSRIDAWLERDFSPDRHQLMAVLAGCAPTRPVLFEFFLNESIYGPLTRDLALAADDPDYEQKRVATSYLRLGYDYVTVQANDLYFSLPEAEQHGRTLSLNERVAIRDDEDLARYPWPDFEGASYARLERLRDWLPEDMGLLVHGPGGVEENVFFILGYDNACYMMADAPERFGAVCERVGAGLLAYYGRAAAYPGVDALIVNDDWGFDRQTLLAPEQLRRWIMPWHRRIVAAIHAAGKPAILHSCGNLSAVMDELIDDVGYDAKHSYEDKIEPVEAAYERQVGRIATLGGIDVDFVCRSEPAAVYERAQAMLARSEGRGGYALGTGNSVPDYVPVANYLALIAAAVWARGVTR